jgi:hypothetical protein
MPRSFLRSISKRYGAEKTIYRIITKSEETGSVCDLNITADGPLEDASLGFVSNFPKMKTGLSYRQPDFIVLL